MLSDLLNLSKMGNDQSRGCLERITIDEEPILVFNQVCPKVKSTLSCYVPKRYYRKAGMTSITTTQPQFDTTAF